ncbi:hypothetical protein AMATHDRAFT_170612 [Amanita thiersii Skay4041]|uniref:DUF676 domain-containing protein n=1 Tax=Amanita thiersii Skay4041 TaxID=703135 RepID=A0A2A9NZK4_9AGAR|nr:hypothetical protein AMATHDRAFT_170612 [Amanita thiersii Skay4041]
MNNVFVPPNVAVLLKRLANVVSTLSISSQYFAHHSDKPNPKELSLPWLARKWSWPPIFSLDSGGPPIQDFPPPPRRQPRKFQTGSTLPDKPDIPHPPDIIHQLIQNPALYDPFRTPRYPIVLWLYGFDSRGPSTFPSLRMHYWANVLKILRGKLGAEVIVTAVPGTGSISSRSATLDKQLGLRAHGRGINLLAHSMGGLDCRYLISHIKPNDYVPLSLTTISTPHRGSPFMDWCAENLGLGKLCHTEGHISTPLKDENKPLDSRPAVEPSTLSFASLPSSFTTLLLSILDSPAYANLTSRFLNDVFNPATPNDPSVKYFSVAGRMSGVNIWHPLWLPKMVLDAFETRQRNRLKAQWEGTTGRNGQMDPSMPSLWAQEREWGNDGLVTIQSAKWGEFLGIMEECDHWEMRGARGIEFGVDLPNIPPLGSGHADGWNFKDWIRFVNLWGKGEKAQHNANITKPELLSSAGSITTTSVGSSSPRLSRSEVAEERARIRERERARDDAVIKSSTDKLSVVMDWLIEQVPSPRLSLSLNGKGMNADVGIGEPMGKGGVKEEVRQIERPKTKRRELETKADLERFYVALCRKLYDEGL